MPINRVWFRLTRLTNDSKFIMKKLLIITSVLTTTLLVGCSGSKLSGVIYRMDIQQGNVLTQDKVGQLEPGMEKRKVRFLLGTPLIVAPFNSDRWDYLYSLQAGGSKRTQRTVSLFFENDRLMRVAGDIEAEGKKAGATAPSENVVTVPDTQPTKGFLSLLARVLGTEDRDEWPRDSEPGVPQERTREAEPPYLRLGGTEGFHPRNQ